MIWKILVVLQERYFKYSMSNCLYSAMVAAIVKECNCIPIYSRVGWRGIYNGLGYISLFLNPKSLMALHTVSTQNFSSTIGLPHCLPALSRPPTGETKISWKLDHIVWGTS